VTQEQQEIFESAAEEFFEHHQYRKAAEYFKIAAASCGDYNARRRLITKANQASLNVK
jgi:hypothetical protein